MAPLRTLEVPPEGDDPAGERGHEASKLVAAVEGRREALDDLRARFLQRMRRASDDFGAIEGLRVTEAALQLIPRPAGLWEWQDRERQTRRRAGRS